MLTASCSMLTAHCLLTAHCSLLTDHFSLLNAPFSLYSSLLLLHLTSPLYASLCTYQSSSIPNQIFIYLFAILTHHHHFSLLTFHHHSCSSLLIPTLHPFYTPSSLHTLYHYSHFCPLSIYSSLSLLNVTLTSQHHYSTSTLPNSPPSLPSFSNFQFYFTPF